MKGIFCNSYLSWLRSRLSCQGGRLINVLPSFSYRNTSKWCYHRGDPVPILLQSVKKSIFRGSRNGWSSMWQFLYCAGRNRNVSVTPSITSRYWPFLLLPISLISFWQCLRIKSPSCRRLVFSGTVHWFWRKTSFHPLLWTSSCLKGTWKLSAYIGLGSLRSVKSVKTRSN